ncbi:MAG: hypothetical protein OES38_09395 [Gammaproteobacteria bacterium]|nr:hypothetical protein [Gammaproteobacteria bacterium]
MILRVLLAVLMLASSPLGAEIYLSTGARGEASFGDVAVPDAVAVAVEVHQPSPAQADSTRERLAETLAIAAELEDARRHREQIYADRRADAQQRAARQTPHYQQPEDQRVISSSYFGDYFTNPGRSHHPGHKPRKPRMPPVRSKRWGRSPDS